MSQKQYIVVDLRAGGVWSTTAPEPWHEVLRESTTKEEMYSLLRSLATEPAVVFAVCIENSRDAITLEVDLGTPFAAVDSDLEEQGYSYRVRGYLRGPQNPWLIVHAQ